VKGEKTNHEWTRRDTNFNRRKWRDEKEEETPHPGPLPEGEENALSFWLFKAHVGNTERRRNMKKWLSLEAIYLPHAPGLRDAG
jgi:hypothetical protein